MADTVRLHKLSGDFFPYEKTDWMPSAIRRTKEAYGFVGKVLYKAEPLVTALTIISAIGLVVSGVAAVASVSPVVVPAAFAGSMLALLLFRAVVRLTPQFKAYHCAHKLEMLVNALRSGNMKHATYVLNGMDVDASSKILKKVDSKKPREIDSAAHLFDLEIAIYRQVFAHEFQHAKPVKDERTGKIVQPRQTSKDEDRLLKSIDFLITRLEKLPKDFSSKPMETQEFRQQEIQVLKYLKQHSTEMIDLLRSVDENYEHRAGDSGDMRVRLYWDSPSPTDQPHKRYVNFIRELHDGIVKA